MEQGQAARRLGCVESAAEAGGGVLGVRVRQVAGRADEQGVQARPPQSRPPGEVLLGQRRLRVDLAVPGSYLASEICSRWEPTRGAKRGAKVSDCQ